MHYQTLNKKTLMHRGLLRGSKVPNSAAIDQTRRTYEIALGAASIGSRMPVNVRAHAKPVSCNGCPGSAGAVGTKPAMTPFKPLTMQELRERMGMSNTEVAKIN